MCEGGREGEGERIPVGWLGEFWARLGCVIGGLDFALFKPDLGPAAALISGALGAWRELGGPPWALLCTTSWVAFFSF